MSARVHLGPFGERSEGMYTSVLAVAKFARNQHFVQELASENG